MYLFCCGDYKRSQQRFLLEVLHTDVGKHKPWKVTVSNLILTVEMISQLLNMVQLCCYSWKPYYLPTNLSEII